MATFLGTGWGRNGLVCLNRTNGKDSRVRLRTSSRTIGEDGSKPNLNPLTLTLTLTLTLRKETKEGN